MADHNQESTIDTTRADARDGPAETGVAASGGGFRAVARRSGQVIWSCPHVHFTEHSAKNCPALRRAGFA